ncbi:BMP family ABC transporter substrate-binding protein [Chloroflexi bacterium TSY]|nr:BMP family ABC transporter substrate-binding protein [Chloroflexi bacterium TSY]
MCKSIHRLIYLAVLLLLVVSCVAPADQSTGSSAENDDAGETDMSGDMTYRLAAIFPGTITDADYNTLGHIGIAAVQDDLGVDIAFSETVAVPDVDRVMREYIDDGFNVIFTHGGQFLSQTQELALEFPDRFFIAEADAEIADAPANLWVIVRNMEIGAYGAGAVAAKLTQTGKIGYITGLTLPFSYAEAHAIEQAIADLGLDVSMTPVWAGDFNDPGKARELAETLISADNDVLVSSLNLGTLGVFEAAKITRSRISQR